jgi:hypothetical protein
MTTLDTPLDVCREHCAHYQHLQAHNQEAWRTIRELQALANQADDQRPLAGGDLDRYVVGLRERNTTLNGLVIDQSRDIDLIYKAVSWYCGTDVADILRDYQAAHPEGKGGSV